MLKWAMRVVAVGGAMLAMAVGTAAWMHRTKGRMWGVATPKVWLNIIISPQNVNILGWLRREWDPGPSWNIGKYGAAPSDWDNADTPSFFDADVRSASSGEVWHGFGIVRGDARQQRAGFTEVLSPTWAVIAVLLLPTGLWAGIGWRQRRRAAAGHCVNCGYDLRATPDKCPECGRAVGISAER